jgi:hypothetical protein
MPDMTILCHAEMVLSLMGTTTCTLENEVHYRVRLKIILICQFYPPPFCYNLNHWEQASFRWFFFSPVHDATTSKNPPKQAL